MAHEFPLRNAETPPTVADERGSICAEFGVSTASLHASHKDPRAHLCKLRFRASERVASAAQVAIEKRDVGKLAKALRIV